MSKRNRLRKETLRTAPVKAAPAVGLKLGDHQFPAFDGVSAAFGARLKDYPHWENIPEEFRRGNAPANKVFSGLFFRGGTLQDHGLKLKAGTDRAVFYTALRALLASFDPKHEHKEATCAWLIAEYAEPIAEPTHV